jgi:plasmid stabilization system protein ParE
VSQPVVLSAEAQTEFDEAVDWYERQAGTGMKFIAQVREVLEGIGMFPEAHAAVHADIRRAVVRRTPYSIFYRVLADRIEVISIFHGRRDPSAWQGRP